MRADLAALALTGLCVVAITVLSVAQVPVPDALTTVTLFSAGGAAGAAVPSTKRARTTP